MEAKRATENAIQKVANIIAEQNNESVEPEVKTATEVIEVDWVFGTTKNEGVDIAALTFI